VPVHEGAVRGGIGEVVEELPNLRSAAHVLVAGYEAVVRVAPVVGPAVVEGVDGVGVLEEELGG